jgi:RNA polymerase sigma-70 factor (ECF subfamily)
VFTVTTIDRFNKALPPGLRARYAESAALQGQLEELVQSAVRRYPSLSPLSSELPAYVAARLDPTSAEAWLPTRHAADLLVALGCTLGNPTALGLFFAHYAPAIARALRRLDLPEGTRADLQQDLYAKLLLDEPGRGPTIARYHGSGSLRRWLQATAINAALKTLSRERLVPVGDVTAINLGEGSDPELALLRRNFREAFDRALEDAIAGLTRDERLLLQQHFVDGSSIDVLARLYRVHRATAARRLARARARLYSETLGLLRRRLDVGQPTFSSLCRLLVSHLDISLTRLEVSGRVADRDGPEEGHDG